MINLFTCEIVGVWKGQPIDNVTVQFFNCHHQLSLSNWWQIDDPPSNYSQLIKSSNCLFYWVGVLWFQAKNKHK